MKITRQNVEPLLDSGSIEIAMRNGNWWTIRRNGRTQRWKSDPSRIRIPFKAGLRVYGALETGDFDHDDALNPAHFRVKGTGGQGREYQPKTGEKCHCRPGVQRDNCPDCEGTGMKIDFKAIRGETP